MARMSLTSDLQAILPSYESLIEISMRLAEAFLVVLAGLAAVLFREEPHQEAHGG